MKIIKFIKSYRASDISFARYLLKGEEDKGNLYDRYCSLCTPALYKLFGCIPDEIWISKETFKNACPIEVWESGWVDTGDYQATLLEIARERLKDAFQQDSVAGIYYVKSVCH